MEEADQLLARNWQWMRQILDSLEKQLKVGEKFDTKVCNIFLKTFLKYLFPIKVNKYAELL